MDPTATVYPSRLRDRGFTILEVLIVVIVLGALAAVATVSLRGITDDGSTNVCINDQRVIATAVELYLGENAVTTIPGDDAQARMDELVQAGLLREATDHVVIDSDGGVALAGSCA